MTSSERNPKSETQARELRHSPLRHRMSFVIRHLSFFNSGLHEARTQTPADLARLRRLPPAPGFLELERIQTAHLRFSTGGPCVPRSVFHPCHHHHGPAGQVRLAETSG